MGMEITKLKVCTKQMNQDNDWIRTLFKKPPPFSFVLSRVSLPLIHPKTAGTAFLISLLRMIEFFQVVIHRVNDTEYRKLYIGYGLVHDISVYDIPVMIGSSLLV